MKINPPPFPGVEYFSGFNYYSKAVIEINYWVWRRNMGAYGGNGSYLIIQLGDKTSLSSHRTPHHLSFSGKTHTHTHTHTHLGCVSVLKNPPAMQEMQVWSLGREDPLEEKWQSTSVFLPENTMDREAWQAAVHGVAKELDVIEQLNNNNTHK